MIKGQESLCNFISNLSISTCPKALVFSGEEGAGKHTLFNLLKETLNITDLDITNSLDYEYIENLYLTSNPCLYLIEGTFLTIKDQNTVLKFLEEPPNNAIIVIIVEDTNLLISTVLNRCTILHLNRYSKDILEEIIGNPMDDIQYNLTNTPGLFFKYSLTEVENTVVLSKKIFDFIHCASLPNTLTISSQVAFNNEKDKIPTKLLFKALQLIAYKYYVANKIPLIAYNITSNLYRDYFTPKLNLKLSFEHYLIELWKIMKRDNA